MRTCSRSWVSGPGVALTAMLISVGLGVTPAGATPRHAHHARAVAPRKAVRHARPAHATGAVPNPDLADDPAQPLGVAWKKSVDRFLSQSRPEFAAFVALDVESGKPITVSEYTADASKIAHPATSAAFPAASVFKMVTASALLETGRLSPSTTMCYHGGMHGLDAGNIKDSKSDRACESMSLAFAKSTNAVFGKLALKYLDADRLVRQAEKLGFNHHLKVDGLETESKVARASDDLTLARMAAGFVNSTMSPLHAAVMAAIVAGGGRLPAAVAIALGRGATKVAAVAKVPAEGAAEPVADDRPSVLDAEAVTQLRAMMVRTSAEGTGRKYFAGMPGRAGGGAVAVKSGTLSSRDGSGLLNTWMVGFFPASKPEFAFAALIATNGAGPVKAGHLARFAIETFLKLKRARAGQS